MDGIGASARPMKTWPHILVAFGVLLIAAASAWQAAAIPKPVLFVAVGPAIAPWFITTFLAACGFALLIAAFRGGWAEDQDGTITEWGSLAYVALGLFINVAIIDYAGFILAASLMFPLVARGFGSKRPLRDAGIGFTVSFLSYVLFDRVLGYKIGHGIIERLIPSGS